MLPSPSKAKKVPERPVKDAWWKIASKRSSRRGVSASTSAVSSGSRRRLRQRVGDALRVAERAVEVVDAVLVAHEQRAIVALDQPPHERQILAPVRPARCSWPGSRAARGRDRGCSCAGRRGRARWRAGCAAGPRPPRYPAAPTTGWRPAPPASRRGGRCRPRPARSCRML